MYRYLESKANFHPRSIKDTSLTKINLSYNNAITAATIVFGAHSCTLGIKFTLYYANDMLMAPLL